MYRLVRKYIVINSTNIQHVNFSTNAKHPDHYKVLKLKPSCTAKEIRTAFIKLSKELHPDANVSNADRKVKEKSFVQLLDAYKVLSKPDTRADYDNTLFQESKPSRHQSEYRTWQPNPPQYQNADPESYYGIKGVKRISNWKIVLLCGVFMLVGIILQVIAINKSVTFNRNQLDERSRKNAITHAQIRAEAETHGNDAQIERMKASLNRTRVW
ncbi:dnaJ-like protein 60 [Malaya genurostris]|uniref:dnaJ-like protein 60 n=1 Tax=Malaya genurostris TaxID=325434 RepID=UPI0026F390C8|nr:dnaJ-like protein 60 [Malaya genurostris]